jgi:EF-P beta-lysylation protein EpmB
VGIPERLWSQKNRDWKIAISESFHNVNELLAFCGLDQLPADRTGEHQFTTRVTRHFASLIEKGNARDPLLLQVLPTEQELQQVNGYSNDAVGDQRCMPVPGLIHKYHGRVLLTLTGACAIHCRYCFRRHFPYGEARLECGRDGPVMTYLGEHTEVTEVILSGGDPLMLNDRKLANLVANLNQVPHIQTLRIHSRLLSVLPERVNEALIETLHQFGGRVVFVTHINHPNEISAENGAVFDGLYQQGFKLFNQAVLLKHVNDNAQTLAELSQRLFENHIIPYYLHRLDKVQGAAHFDISKEESCRIYTQLRKQLPGYLLPTLVEEIPGRRSKIPLRCD